LFLRKGGTINRFASRSASPIKVTFRNQGAATQMRGCYFLACYRKRELENGTQSRMVRAVKKPKSSFIDASRLCLFLFPTRRWQNKIKSAMGWAITFAIKATAKLALAPVVVSSSSAIAGVQVNRFFVKTLFRTPPHHAGPGRQLAILCDRSML
jgi:hypothetical protein